MEDVKYAEENGKKTVIIPMDCYTITGVATIKLWSGKVSKVKMDSFELPPDSKLTDKEIFENCNDGQYGCKKILWVEVAISENYDGYLRCVEEREIDGQLLEGIQDKKGIAGLESKKDEVKSNSKDTAVDVWLYGSKYTYKNLKEAKKDMAMAMRETDGAEQSRYTDVYMQMEDYPKRKVFADESGIREPEKKKEEGR